MAGRKAARPDAAPTSRLRVVARTLAYPALESDRARIRAAGGFSKLPADVRASIRFKEVHPGDYCDDMPPESIPDRLARGDIARVSAKEAHGG